MKKKTKLIWGGIFIALVAIALGTYSLREPIFIEAGNFMAPTGDYKADIVILEGSDYIRTGFIQTGMALLSSGKVKKIIVVIHRIAPAHRPFGIGGDYPDIVRQKLRDMGLKEHDFKVIVAPIRHPVTLKEAQFVLKDLADDHIYSAILVAPSFHTRRSYLCYQYVGEPLKIKIYPLASFTDYRFDKWWTSEAGWRDFGSESQKLIYYLAGRHIPFKFSY
jgi:hypothetical protein